MDASNSRHNGSASGFQSGEPLSLVAHVKSADVSPARCAAALLLLHLAGDDVDVDDAPDAVQDLFRSALG